MSNRKEFAHVHDGLTRLEDIYERLEKDEFTSENFTLDEMAIVTNPMGYLAAMFDLDGFWSEDLMYALMAKYKPFKERRDNA